MAADLVLQMPRELYQPELAELLISLHQPRQRDLLPPARSPLLGDSNPYGSLKHHFLAGHSVAGRSTCNTLSVRVGLHLAPRRSLTSMPWFACAPPPATKSFRPACNGLSLLP